MLWRRTRPNSFFPLCAAKGQSKSLILLQCIIQCTHAHLITWRMEGISLHFFHRLDGKGFSFAWLAEGSLVDHQRALYYCRLYIDVLLLVGVVAVVLILDLPFFVTNGMDP